MASVGRIKNPYSLCFLKAYVKYLEDNDEDTEDT